jgi:hypothetical protein
MDLFEIFVRRAVGGLGGRDFAFGLVTLSGSDDHY